MDINKILSKYIHVEILFWRIYCKKPDGVIGFQFGCLV
jgi:hypothetical protein